VELQKVKGENKALKALVEQLEDKVSKIEQKNESLKTKYFDIYETHKRLEDQ